MCLLITPRYGCGHKDTPWHLYCNPTRKICGRKHPPLDVCRGKDVSKQEWNVFEPRCSKCESKHRVGLEKARRKSTVGFSGAAGLLARRRTGSLLEDLREIFRSENNLTLSGRKGRGSESESDKGDSTSDVDSFRTLELRQTLTLDGIEVEAIEAEPDAVGSLRGTGSSSSLLESLPCSPRTTKAPGSQDYFG